MLFNLISPIHALFRLGDLSYHNLSIQSLQELKEIVEVDQYLPIEFINEFYYAEDLDDLDATFIWECYDTLFEEIIFSILDDPDFVVEYTEYGSKCILHLPTNRQFFSGKGIEQFEIFTNESELRDRAIDVLDEIDYLYSLDELA